jgi:hypothetical protein
MLCYVPCTHAMTIPYWAPADDAYIHKCTHTYIHTTCMLTACAAQVWNGHVECVKVCTLVDVLYACSAAFVLPFACVLHDLHPALPCPALPCPALPCPVLSCPVLSCPVLSCPVLSCPVLSCPALTCSTLLYLASCWWRTTSGWTGTATG